MSASRLDPTAELVSDADGAARAASPASSLEGPWLAAPGIVRAAVGLTLFQLAIALLFAGGKLRNLVYWDATWYRDIAELGYSVSFPLVHHPEGGSNIAFFPAFPLWTRAVLRALPIAPNTAVLAASWGACLAMWGYLVALLRRMGAGAGWAWAALLAFLVQPGAFYAVSGYSESLFTAAMLGYVLWSDRALQTAAGRRAWAWAAIAAAHGLVLTGTRIVGVPLAAFPLLLALARALPARGLRLRARPRQIAAALGLGLVALTGFAAFLLYCQLRWGRWDLYWEANRVGWNVYFDPWKLLSWSYYRDVFFVGNLSEVLGRLLTVTTLGAAVALASREWRRVRADARDPLPLALAAINLGLLAETIVGSHGMHSMVRYLIPIHALLFVGIAGAGASGEGEASHRALRRIPGYALTGLALFALELLFLSRYVRGDWVS